MNPSRPADRYPWATDLNRFCERLAERLRWEGSRNPLAAAVAIAVRGSRGATEREFADQIGVPLEHLQRIGDGHVPIADLPPALVAVALATDGLDWSRVTGAKTP